MEHPLIRPTESELEILNIIWKSGPSSVRDVNDFLNKKKRVGYTTTLKLMQIMTEKGILSRIMDGRIHIYEARLKEEEVQSNLVDRLLDTAFGGSAKKLVMQALGNHRASENELEEIKQLIKKLEEENDGNA